MVKEGGQPEALPRSLDRWGPESLKKKGERNSTLFTLPERTGDRVNPSVVLGTSNLL